MADQFFTAGLSPTGGLVGTDKFPYDDPAGGSFYATATELAAFGTAAAVAAIVAAYGSVLNLPNGQYHADTSTAGFTATGGEVAGARDVVLDLTGTLVGAASLQLPTAAALVAAVPDAVVGETYVLRVLNNSSGAFAWTLTTNTGITLNGTVTINQNQWREWLVTLTSLTAVSLQNIGAGDS